MYVTAANECVALDAGSGREIWHFKRPRTKGVAGGGANRGVAVAGDRVFMVTDHAHLVALNRFTGEVLWDSVMDDWRKNYAASSAPLTAGDLVVSGVSGGEHGANGFVVALRPGHRSRGVAVLDRAQARPARLGDVEGQGHRATAARPRGSPAATTPRSTRCTGPPAIRARNTTATTGRATTCTRAASSRSTARPAGSSGTISSRRTTCGTGTPRRPRCSSTPTGRASAGR